MSTLHHSRKGYITCNAYSTEQRVFLCVDLSRTAWKVSPVSASLWRCCGASESLFSSSSILRSAEPELADVLEVVLRQCATLSEDELPAPQNVSKVPDVLRHHTWRNVRYLTFYVTMPDVPSGTLRFTSPYLHSVRCLTFYVTIPDVPSDTLRFPSEPWRKRDSTLASTWQCHGTVRHFRVQAQPRVIVSSCRGRGHTWNRFTVPWHYHVDASVESRLRQGPDVKRQVSDGTSGMVT